MPTFEEAVEQINSLPSRPTNDELLEIYGLYKQATVGDNTTPQPGMFDLKGKAKWNVWTERKGMSQEEAKRLYVEKAAELAAKYP